MRFLASDFFHESSPYGSLIHTLIFFSNSQRNSNSKLVPWDKDRDRDRDNDTDRNKDMDRNKDTDRNEETDRNKDRDRNKDTDRNKRQGQRRG